MGRYYTEATGGATRELVEEIVLGWPEVTASKLFGCPSYRGEGILFAFVSDWGLVLTKLSDEERVRADEELGPEPEVDLAGKSAKWRFVEVDDGNAAQVAPFLRICYEHALAEAGG